MPFLHTALTLFVVFILLVFVNRYLNGNSRLIGVINIVIVFAVLVWLLRGFGAFSGLNMA
jgi:hypothetical protein